jgi:predicted metal-dependent peptidase|tara:strand:- start:1557 stop:2852 length:1296 start_codon:yes stop_codon:yes gene_type:complete
MSKAGTTADSKESDKFKDLIGPMDPKLDREVREILTTARVGLLLKASFFGNLATRLTLTNADEWCPTAATDGRKFYYNSRFIKMLRPKEVEFLFGHEVLHCVYDHFGRRGDRDPQLWNIADDYCVNGDLKKHNVGEFITSVPCLYDKKYEGLSAEEVYDILYENAEKIDINQLIDQMIDQHLDGDGDGDGEGGGDGEGDDKTKGRPRLSAEERQQIKDEIKEAMLSAAAADTDGIGNLPLGVRRIIQELTEPKMNWRELLRMQLESTIKSDYTWMRASRKGWDMDAIMPGMKRDPMIDIALMIDASGSMRDTMLKDILSETASIMESFPAYKIHVATFDTEVYNPKQYDSENLEDIREYEIKGGGGTDFTCVFDYLKQEEIEPKRLIVFTDGYPYGSWGDENYADTVWILHGTTTIVPPWGQHAYYEEETT